MVATMGRSAAAGDYALGEREVASGGGGAASLLGMWKRDDRNDGLSTNLEISEVGRSTEPALEELMLRCNADLSLREASSCALG